MVPEESLPSPQVQGPPNAQVTRSYGKLPVIPKKKRSRGGDLGFLYPRKRPSSHDDDYEEVEEAKGARILTGFVNRNNHSKTRKKKGRKKGKMMINSSNRKRCSVLEDIDEEEGARSSTSKRRKSESKALNLGFYFSNEIKALIGEDGDKDFKLKIRKKLFQTDTMHTMIILQCPVCKSMKPRIYYSVLRRQESAMVMASELH
ncbi:hypothetical protein OIU85_007184 [Salix viminalis]|uniref:Uncharacterized protein n=1 Tax=Salix viminalis TaxID=40686 RepID=A0A9Q0P886_SALVM|nr:hypothetical protein OIU85_007184 [Salix viminalis]